MNVYRGKYNAEELEYLHEHYAETPTKELAERMNRTYSSVSHMAFKLNLKKNNAKFMLFYEGELLGTGTVKELSKELFLSEYAIRSYIYDYHERYNYSAVRVS